MSVPVFSSHLLQYSGIIASKVPDCEPSALPTELEQLLYVGKPVHCNACLIHACYRMGTLSHKIILMRINSPILDILKVKIRNYEYSFVNIL